MISRVVFKILQVVVLRIGAQALPTGYVTGA